MLCSQGYFQPNIHADTAFKRFCQAAIGRMTLDEFVDDLNKKGAFSCWRGVYHEDRDESEWGGRRPFLIIGTDDDINCCTNQYSKLAITLGYSMTADDLTLIRAMHDAKNKQVVSKIRAQLISNRGKRLLETVSSAYYFIDNDSIRESR